MNHPNGGDPLLDATLAARIVEANEQLILALVRIQSEADTAAGRLDTMSRSAEFDPLTGLPNRVLLADRMARAIVSARRRKTGLALMFLDLDGFKQINDTHGHATGDEVLRQVGRCLSSAVREADTVSRHGGDEFLILLAEVSQPADAANIASMLLAALAALATPTVVSRSAIRLTASIGISLYPVDGEDMDTLTQRADAAMYRAKRRGQGGFVFHGDASGEKVNPQLCLATINAPPLHAAAEQSRGQQTHGQQTQFLAALAHELRNPLAPLRTVAALLSRVTSEELPRLQAIIERQVAHLARLVDDVLDVSRVTTGKLRVEHQSTDLGSIVDAAADACRPAMRQRQQQFSIRVPNDALTLEADPVRLTQVLSNLLDNASKYSAVGGTVDLCIELDEIQDRIVIAISDSGIGIAPDALPTIFEPFIQDRHAVDFNGVGLGIGLTVVRELVSAHGGSVTASSAGRGLGSRFVVNLPRRQATGLPVHPAAITGAAAVRT